MSSRTEVLGYLGPGRGLCSWCDAEWSLTVLKFFRYRGPGGSEIDLCPMCSGKHTRTKVAREAQARATTGPLAKSRAARFGRRTVALGPLPTSEVLDEAIDEKTWELVDRICGPVAELVKDWGGGDPR